MLHRISGFMVLLLLLGHPASAAPGDPSDVLGSWTFQTKPYHDGGCVMSGTMTLSDAAQTDAYDCELTAVETCSEWGRSVVVQKCEARRLGNQLSVRSRVTQMLEYEATNATYYPDNFTLTVQNASRMWGALVSVATAPVEFRRNDGGIS